MSITRKTLTIFDEDSVLTLLRPYTCNDKIIVINEDMYGEIISTLETRRDLSMRLNLSEDEFQEIINQL